MGRGCRMGPGPDTEGSGAVGGCAAAAGAIGGDGREGLAGCGLLTVFWFDGRMLREEESEACAGSGGGGMWCEEERRGAVGGCGEAGTELRSGIVVEGDDGDDVDDVGEALVVSEGRYEGSAFCLGKWVRLISLL